MIVIARAPGGMVEYFTLDKLYIVGSPMGAFCEKREHAFRFGRTQDATRFMQQFLSQWPGVKVMELADGE